LVLARGYGLADVEAGARVARDDMFRIASLSKLVTAAAVLKLVEQDRIDLDAPAFGYLPDLPAPGGATEDPRLATITVRQLLHHAGGWDREVSYDPMFMSTYIAGQLGEPAPSSADMVVRWMRGQPLDFDPGSRFAYSNFGYAVLGRIIEAVTEQPYDTWVQHNVLAPAGITRMRIGHTRLEDRADGEVRYYGFSGEPLATESVFPDVDGSVPWPYGGWYQESLDAHGGWIASAVDLSRFLLAIDGRDTYADIINAGSVAAMTARPELPDWDFTAYWYGMGVSVRPSGGDANWWHNGALPGTATIFVRSYHGFTWVALFNSRPADQSFFGAMDSTMWTALNTVESWPDYDLFDQYE
jgi:N-acyl-D-amino-acid deacylase